MDAYREAIHQVVRQGDIVFDLGAGTGILGLHACSAGAKSVHAVEPTDIIAVVPDIAQANGFAERIHPHKCASFHFEPDEKADVIIASMLPSGAFANNFVQVVGDASKRLLKPNGIIIPKTIHAAFCPVELPDWYEGHVACWDAPKQGFAFNSIHAVSANRPRNHRISSSSLIAIPARAEAVVTLEPPERDLQVDLAFVIQRDSVAHAVASWIEVNMTDRVVVGNCPVGPTNTWDNLLLPLETPLKLVAGETARVSIRADFLSSDTILSWHVSVHTHDGKPRVELNQSTFLGKLLPFVP